MKDVFEHLPFKIKERVQGSSLQGRSYKIWKLFTAQSFT